MGTGSGCFYCERARLSLDGAAFRKMMVNQRDEIELGYSVTPALWGQGYATEMSTKALEIAFTTFHYPSVVSFTRIDNGRSERVMQKLEFQFEATIVHAGEQHLLYRHRNPNMRDAGDGK